MSQTLLWHIVEALGLGIGAGMLIWLLRNFAPVRRIGLSAWLAVLLLGLYVIVRGSGLPAEDSIVRIVTALGVMLAAHALLQLFDLILWDYTLGQRRHVIVPRLLIDLFNLVVLIGVALAVLNAVFGVELGALVITSTVLSAVLGLALQDMLGNIVAGIALQIERPFSVGDWVSVSAQEGQVAQMNWRTLTVRTRRNHIVILPNSSIARQEIVNYSRPAPLQQVQVSVGIAYRHPPGLVKESLARAAAAAEGVLREPAPDVLLHAFGDSAIQYEIRFWIADYAHLPEITDAVLSRVWYRLKRDGLDIPFPARDVVVRTLPEDHAIRAQQKLRGDVFAELRGLPLLKPLNDQQIEQLTQGADIQRFGAGEVLVREGEQGDSLYTIKSGRVRVETRNEGGPAKVLARLGRAEFFGEMSLLTGEPRNASVIAESETEVVVVDKADLATVLQPDSSLVEALSLVLEERMRAKAALAPEAPGAPGAAPAPLAIITRIRGFFGLRQM